jgi:hypothetical protein
MRIVSCTHSAAPICADCLLRNVRIERLSIDEALARLAFAVPAAITYHSEPEGWDMFNLPSQFPAPDAYLDTGVERYDDLGIFDSDDDALRYVAERAAAGSAAHLAALYVEGACNSIRAIMWGEDYVDSRMGPPILQPVRQA